MKPASFAGLLLRGLGRGATRRAVKRGRFRRPRMFALALGGVVTLLSITTCSGGVDPSSLTAEYGDPVPASPAEARRFVEKVAAAVQGSAGTRQLRLAVDEAEATSALSLGLMLPELMRAMETMPEEEIRGARTIEEMRERIRRHEEVQHPRRNLVEKVLDALDPHLRTGDVQVRFTGEGQVVVAGWVQAWRWRQPALIVVAPRARGGELSLDFVKGRLGRLPAPERAFDLLGGMVSSLILLGDEYVELSELSVDRGRMTFAAGAAR
jgi:hypothetical protein